MFLWHCGQNFDIIREEVTDKNVYQFYGQAYAMKCDKLLKDILEHIGTALLNLESVAHFLELAIEFKIESLLEDTSKLIVTRFMHVAEANPKFIYLLPHKVMVEILEDDDLNVHEEYDLVHWVKEYFKYHEEHAVKVP